MKPLLITSGEPAGIGPDLCLMLAAYNLPVVIAGDKEILACRAKKLKLSITFKEYSSNNALQITKNQLNILSIPCGSVVVPGALDVRNAGYVINMLTQAAKACKEGEFSGLVTAPVHKGILNDAGIPFSGHTEFFADFFGVDDTVMLLASSIMKVALVTTHLPLSQVPEAITKDKLKQVLVCLHKALKQDFGLKDPKLAVAGLNPHAGESGHLGREEIDIIVPVLQELKVQGLNLHGPFSADTLFLPFNATQYDVLIAMYHDQGLPVLKYSGFETGVNVTLGLPIVRTSVDHGTALELAGTGKAESGSLLSAVSLAGKISAQRRESQAYD